MRAENLAWIAPELVDGEEAEALTRREPTRHCPLI
jgi:hypothetical protein